MTVLLLREMLVNEMNINYWLTASSAVLKFQAQDPRKYLHTGKSIKRKFFIEVDYQKLVFYEHLFYIILFFAVNGKLFKFVI